MPDVRVKMTETKEIKNINKKLKGESNGRKK